MIIPTASQRSAMLAIALRHAATMSPPRRVVRAVIFREVGSDKVRVGYDYTGTGFKSRAVYSGIIASGFTLDAAIAMADKRTTQRSKRMSG